MKKKPDWQDRIERTLKDSLKVQQSILAACRLILETDRLILDAIIQSVDRTVNIHPGTPKFLCKSADMLQSPPARRSKLPRKQRSKKP